MTQCHGVATANGARSSSTMRPSHFPGRPAITTLTNSMGLSNVFEVRDGAEIAGVGKSGAISATKTLSDTASIAQPMRDLANGFCNNITLPLGLVLLADLFRRGIFRRKRDEEEKTE